MNISDISAIRECTSCQMCGAVCPTDAITIRLNDDGFYRPYVDIDKCVDCGLCVKSCYKFDADIESSDLTEKEMFSAWANDPRIIEETTSGGIADILARQLIEQGYKCIGVRYNPDKNIAEGHIASNVKDTLPFRGSKYIQSLSVDSFKKLAKECRKEKFAVFGLPCQIYAIDRFLTARGVRDNHILIDLYCHGCPSINAWGKYVGHVLKKVDGKKVISANFRSKIRGWGNFYVVVVVVEGVSYPIRVVSPRINDGFYELFFSDLILNDSCSNCLLRSTLAYTDIRLGDFWGHSFVNNHTGVSGISAASTRGRKAIDQIRPFATIRRQEFSDFLPYQSYGKTYNVDTERRNRLLGMLADNSTSIHDCVRAYHAMMPLKTRIKHELKNIVKLMPNPLISFIKGRFYAIRH